MRSGWCSNCDEEDVPVHSVMAERTNQLTEDTTVCDACWHGGWSSQVRLCFDRNEAIAIQVRVQRYFAKGGK